MVIYVVSSAKKINVTEKAMRIAVMKRNKDYKHMMRIIIIII